MTPMKKISIEALFLFVLMLRCGDEPLDVRITYPVNDTRVSGIIRIEAETSSNVTAVLFHVDSACIDSSRAAPFACSWNTFAFSDSSYPYLYAIARDRRGETMCSDSVLVLVDNGDVIFADLFETYPLNSYPHAAWFQIWPGAGNDHTYVTDLVSFGGAHSFRLRGLGDWVRTDGVELNLSNGQHLTYELNVMIPSPDSAGALFGFFSLIDPTTGMICNGVLFDYNDGLVYAHGAVEDSTGRVWLHDTWYSVRVALDYGDLDMDVWVDDEQIVFDLPAVPMWWSDTFAISTEYGAPGIVYYDDVKISQQE